MIIDNRAIFYKKSLIDSGTSGSKGHSQVIVPMLTESYTSAEDPSNFTLPHSSLYFPFKIQHSLQWAFDVLFQEEFVNNPKVITKYLEEPNFLKVLFSFITIFF